jgi:hypothetical protein
MFIAAGGRKACRKSTAAHTLLARLFLFHSVFLVLDLDRAVPGRRNSQVFLKNEEVQLSRQVQFVIKVRV